MPCGRRARCNVVIIGDHLAVHGMPAQLSDLDQHSCIVYAAGRRVPMRVRVLIDYLLAQ
ncbi:hypothetical protein GTP56_13515 [Duganella sp. FT134W]|uniref:Uncharacterized protein n=1 Tax=Duganella margarita TaxID=2692170 RepID=A0A7X4KH32_9BURK|nr:hypothetical protein [Duganella margarita]MYM73209.1 hypothetical protein [Duganella margarita]